MGKTMVSPFLAAADWFCGIAERQDVASRWTDKSALPGYTIGGLVAHVGAAVAWLGPLLDAAPPDDAGVIGLGDYYGPLAVREPEDFDAGIHTMARAQGERGAQRGPAETVAKLRGRVDGLRQRLAEEDGNRILDLRPTLPAAMGLDDFLATRVLELVVHGDDLAVSVGATVEPPPEAAAIAIQTLLATARRQHGDVEVLRALAREERSVARVVPVL